jgi:hypothetical protein
MKVHFCPVLSCIQRSTVLFEGLLASRACPSDKISIKMKIDIDHCYTVNDKEKPKYSEKTLCHRHFYHHKHLVDCPGSELGPPVLTTAALPCF